MNDLTYFAPKSISDSTNEEGSVVVADTNNLMRQSYTRSCHEEEEASVDIIKRPAGLYASRSVHIESIVSQAEFDAAIDRF